MLRRASRHDGTLAADTQRRLFRWAERVGDVTVTANLAGRVDLAEDLAGRIAEDRTPQVRQSWLTRTTATLEEFRAELRAEKRQRVLLGVVKDLVDLHHRAMADDSTTEEHVRSRLRVFVEEAPSLSALVWIVTSAGAAFDDVRRAAVESLHRAPGSVELSLEKDLRKLLRSQHSSLRDVFLRSVIHPSMLWWVPQVADEADLDPETAQRLWDRYAAYVVAQAPKGIPSVAAALNDAYKLAAHLPEPVEAVEELVAQLPKEWPTHEAAAEIVASLREWASTYAVLSGSDSDAIAELLAERLEHNRVGLTRLIRVAFRNQAVPEGVLVELLMGGSTPPTVAAHLLERPMSPTLAAALSLRLHRPAVLAYGGDTEAAAAALPELFGCQEDPSAYIVDLFESGVLDGVPAELRAKLLSFASIHTYHGDAAPEVAELLLDVCDDDARSRFGVEFSRDFECTIGDVIAAVALT